MINIAYVILHWAGNSGMAIGECNHIMAVKKTWVSFRQFFRTSHRELRETYDLTVEDARMHHVNMLHNVVSGIQEAFQKE